MRERNKKMNYCQETSKSNGGRKLSKNEAPTWLSGALGKQHNRDMADTQNEHNLAETRCRLCSATSDSQEYICSIPVQAGNTTRTSSDLLIIFILDVLCSW